MTTSLIHPICQVSSTHKATRPALVGPPGASQRQPRRPGRRSRGLWLAVVLLAGLVGVQRVAAFIECAPNCGGGGPPSEEEPAPDDSEKLVTAAQAAICGPEYKDLSVNGHDFNVKEATVGMSPSDDTTAVVAGQISHRLGFGRPDDQIYYTINYKDGVPDEPKIRIDHGGVAGVLDIITDAISFGGDKIEILGIELELNPEKLPEIATEISKLVEGGGWEEQATAMITVIGTAAATQPVDEVCN
jgi:hypothetical protein